MRPGFKELNQIGISFFFLDDINTENKGKSWSREKYCEQDINWQLSIS